MVDLRKIHHSVSLLPLDVDETDESALSSIEKVSVLISKIALNMRNIQSTAYIKAHPELNSIYKQKLTSIPSLAELGLVKPVEKIQRRF